MKRFVKFCVHFLEKLILPYYCVMCLEISNQPRDLCRPCQKQLPTSLHTCQQCGIKLPDTLSSHRCGPCSAHPPYVDNTVVGFDYQAPIDLWLRQFKFHKKGLYARILTDIYAEKLLQRLNQHPEQKPQVLIPMPLHWRRLTQRGFNQSYIIARRLSQQLNIPLLKHTAVTRIKYTQAQSSLPLLSRKRNIHGAFFVQPLAGIHHVAIIDDIITTGSTVNELSKQLKRMGITYISVWAIARVN